jgi:hypothetical protein
MIIKVIRIRKNCTDLFNIFILFKLVNEDKNHVFFNTPQTPLERGIDPEIKYFISELKFSPDPLIEIIQDDSTQDS